MSHILVLDQNIVNFFFDIGQRSNLLFNFLKFLGIYGIYLIPLFLIVFWFRGSNKIALLAVIAGLISWQLFAKIAGHLINRPRPFLEINFGKELLFWRPTYSFPSDHAAFLGGVAIILLFSKYKKVGIWFLIGSFIISLPRIFLGFHFLSDIISGFALGMFIGWLIWFIREPLEKYIINPVVEIAQKLRLAS